MTPKHWIWPLLLAALVAVSVAYAAEPARAQQPRFTTEPEVKAIKTRKPVKIKLKRSESGKYNWEITGDDADDVLDADRRLRDSLKGK